MKNFEYRTRCTYMDTLSEDVLTEYYGKGGWELISVVVVRASTYYYFKKEISND
jgi:hypothetical protein